MSPRRCLVALAVMVLSGLGCHANVEKLTDARAYEEAMCGAAHYSRRPEQKLELVGQALDRDARPRLHLGTIAPAQLEAAYGEVGRRFSEQVVLVRGTTAIDEVGVDDFGLTLTLVGPSGPIPEEVATRELLALHTGEAIPAGEVVHTPSRRRFVTERWGRRPIMGWVAGALEVSTLLLVPVTVMTGHTRIDPASSRTIPPTEDEIASATPVATSLARAAEAQSLARNDLGLETSTVFLWPRLEDETVPLSIVVEWAYATGKCTPPGAQLRRTSQRSAHVARSVRLPLPPGPTLEARITAAFGDRVQPLVRAAPGR